MKGYWLIMCCGLVVILNGCGTTSQRVLSEGAVSNGTSPQMQPYFAFGDAAQTDKGLKVTMDSNLLFKVGHSHLSQAGIQKMDDLAALLLKNPADQVSLIVYTDNSGSEDGDLRISKRRAKALQAELVRQGYSAANLTAIGKGAADPVAANDTPENQAKNRRIEIIIAAP